MRLLNFLLLMGLFSFLAACWAEKDRHPEMPFLPGATNSRIKIDSAEYAGIDRFIFSADRKKIYALVAQTAGGGTYNHYLIELDENGKKLRELYLGDMGRVPTTLSLLDSNTLIWDYSNVFYIVNLPSFKVIDEVFTYYQYDYPKSKENEKLINEKVGQEFEARRVKIAEKYDIQKIDSVSLEIVEGNKKNAEAYWTEFRAAKKESDSMIYTLRQKYYEEYANNEIKTGTWFLGYKLPESDTEYLFTKVASGKVVAFQLDKGISRNGYDFARLNLNPDSEVNRNFSSMYSYPTRGIKDKDCSLRITEQITTEYNQYKLKGPDKKLFYYEMQVGDEKTAFKWEFPVMVSNDFYLRSANGNTYIVANSKLYRFSLQ
ncbi:hypothetical protein [Emticicia agri]|uniref:DUF4221 domain-containing protein n=1 Tax=Emticicia agri TaxID=2492393 RepID=A0A4V1ZDX0_9BACT|nr:hypothetical protein [Emticicia agri]RYU97630.1 hypothetical protein EWM59_00470 [Emticicia agri]